MRLFFRRRIPPVERILLVESGSRSILEALLPRIRSAFGSRTPVDLVTCYPGLPEGLPPDSRVFRVSEYAGRAGRRRLYRELRSLGYSLLGIVCSGEPIMNKWKWALALQLPAKVFIVNENADFFWFDYGQRRTMIHFALVRSGWGGAGAVRTAAQFAVFPLTLVFLLLYAAAVHSRRFLRLFARRYATQK
jgi:hypothetical protein